jgi:hypothetical protein
MSQTGGRLRWHFLLGVSRCRSPSPGKIKALAVASPSGRPRKAAAIAVICTLPPRCAAEVLRYL